MADHSIEFRDPPPSGRSPGAGPSHFWLEVADMCRARPGEWACVGEWVENYASTIKSGRLTAFRGGGFEATSRSDGALKGRATIYVRYVGDAS